MNSGQASVLLFDLALIIAAARLFGAVARRLRQPPVVGEILVGILLGPTVLGAGASAVLIPPGVRPHLSSLASLGLVMFMFVMGLQVDHGMGRGGGLRVAGISLGSIAVPFLLGAGLACYLAERHAPAQAEPFVVFVGLAMSVTAFPVLARILADHELQHTRLGSLALACAAVGDVLAWLFLAALVAVAGATDADPWRLVLLVPYVLVMLAAVRPLLARSFARRAAQECEESPGGLVVLVAGMLVSAAATEWLGLHFVFGAFFFGAIVPPGWLRQALVDEVQPVSRVLLPAFFVVAGLSVDLGSIGRAGLGDLALVLVVGTSGKFLGVFVAARLSGMTVHSATALAALMNARGVTELVILNIGLQLGLIGGDLYSLMVVMAVVTTLTAAPVLRATGHGRPITADGPLVPSMSPG